MVFERKLFGRPRRRFWARFPELQSRVHSNVFIKNNVFEKKIFLFLLLFLGGVFPYFRRKFYSTVDKSAIFMSEGTIDGKQFFRKNRSYSITTDFQQFAFEIWQEASTELPKLHNICQINLLRKNIFFEQKV